LALNYRRFGNSAAANLALIAGLIGTVVLMAIAFVLPDSFPNSVLPAAYTFGMYQSVKSLQGSAYEHQLANGAIKGSGWMAAGVGILSLLVILVALFAVVLVAPEGWFAEEL
jgi:low temperature requirement protein LtrA